MHLILRHMGSLVPSLFAGLGIGLSLIVAIGAQNAFVLRQGLRRHHIGTVIALCAASDAVLIGVGVLGGGALFNAAPWLVTVARLGGALFLFGYAGVAAVRAARPRTLQADVTGPVSRTAVILTTLALTWLNPHVYLDAFVLLGSIASTYGDARWGFGLGAILGSCLWFVTLGYGARLLAPVFRQPRAWRVLDAVIAVIMTAHAIGLLAK